MLQFTSRGADALASPEFPPATLGALLSAAAEVPKLRLRHLYTVSLLSSSSASLPTRASSPRRHPSSPVVAWILARTH